MKKLKGKFTTILNKIITNKDISGNEFKILCYLCMRSGNDNSCFPSLDTIHQDTDDEIEYMDEWVKKPDIYLDEDQLQKIYDYPQGSIWDFLLQAFGIKKIPTVKDRISQGYDAFVSTYNFNERQIKQLNKFKKIFIANAENRTGFSPDSIFSNRVYEKKIGTRKENDEIFEGKFDVVFDNIKHSLNLPSSWQ